MTSTGNQQQFHGPAFDLLYETPRAREERGAVLHFARSECGNERHEKGNGENPRAMSFGRMPPRGWVSFG